MRNALLLPMTSPLYNFGNSEVQIPNLGVSMSMDSKINFRGGSFYLDSNFFTDDDENQLQNGEFGFPYQSFISYPPVTGYQSPSSTCENISQQSTMLCKNVSAYPWVEMDFQARQMRKRTIDEVNCLFPDGGINDVLGNGTESGEWKKSKRKKGTSSEDQWRHLVKESKTIPEPKVAVRRSQRLSDRITALQKLVSPYGKTDTSAVLQEAVLYIKLLQEQIQNLYQIERSSYGSHVTAALHQSQEIGGEMKDLRSRGLCLVPVSLTQNVVLQEADIVDPNAYLRNAILAGSCVVNTECGTARSRHC